MSTFRLENTVNQFAGCSWHLQRPIEAMLLWIWNEGDPASAPGKQLPTQTCTSRAHKSGRRSGRKKLASQHAASSGKQRPDAAHACDAAAAADGWAVADKRPDMRLRSNQDQGGASASRMDVASAWARLQIIRPRSVAPSCSDASIATLASMPSAPGSPISTIRQVASPGLVSRNSGGNIFVNRELTASAGSKHGTSASSNGQSAGKVSSSKANASFVADPARSYKILGKQDSGKKAKEAPRHSGSSQTNPVRSLSMESRISQVRSAAEDMGFEDDPKQPSKGQSAARSAFASGPGPGTAKKHKGKNVAAIPKHASDARLQGKKRHGSAKAFQPPETCMWMQNVATQPQQVCQMHGGQDDHRCRASQNQNPATPAEEHGDTDASAACSIDAETEGRPGPVPQSAPPAPQPPADGRPFANSTHVAHAPADAISVDPQTECSHDKTTDLGQGATTLAIRDERAPRGCQQPPQPPANLFSMSKNRSDVMGPSPVAKSHKPTASSAQNPQNSPKIKDQHLLAQPGKQKADTASGSGLQQVPKKSHRPQPRGMQQIWDAGCQQFVPEPVVVHQLLSTPDGKSLADRRSVWTAAGAAGTKRASESASGAVQSGGGKITHEGNDHTKEHELCLSCENAACETMFAPCRHAVLCR